MRTPLRSGLAVVGLLLILAGSAKADPYRVCAPSAAVAVHTSADYYRPGELVTVTVLVNQPSWVMVVETDERGFVRRLIESARGVRVAPGRPLVLRFDAEPDYARGYTPVTRTLTVFSQPARFRKVSMKRGVFEPPGVCVHCGFAGLCEMHFPSGNTGRNGHNTAIATHTRYTVLAYPRSHFRSEVVWPAWVWGIPANARIFVDGAFVGIGVDACLRLPAGRHRVTVVSQDGVKESRLLSLSAPTVDRKAGALARGDRDGMPGYRYKERR